MAIRWTLRSTVPIAKGVEIPMLGLGVYQSRPGQETYDAVRLALEVGYRHVDTARVYGNERDVGRAVRDSGIPRDQVFVTTKLWNADHGYDPALRACDQSLARLGMDRVDLYLVHWPVEGQRAETWRAMERVLADGKARAIGVSNYTIRHLDELAGYASVPPAVNQVEFHPFLYQRDLLDRCRRTGVRLEAYAPLVKAQRMEHPVLVRVARRHGKTPAQILIRWCLEHEVVVIPKSVRPERIRENLGVFDFSLGAEDMAELDALDEGYRTSWDPTPVP
ncbi:MAG TPA: aldo/keto reductase [Anaeromyxobacteraceae bacterium]|nr:aldo/keto reductase [Anaeromyxobacteraceae bacterium]